MKYLPCLCLAALASGQEPENITLEKAVQTALKNNPRISIDTLSSLASGEVTTEVKSGLYPAITANASGVGATKDARLSAFGAINNPLILGRLAFGTSISQLITDFGRTGKLVESARLHSQSQREIVQSTRAQIALAVHRAYFAALRARALLRVAGQTIDSRQLVVDQVTALMESKMKSQLDVSFAQVNLSEAKMFLAEAENQYESALADLSAAMGYNSPRKFALDDREAPSQTLLQNADLLATALKNRPELAALRLERESAASFAVAEKRLNSPVISALGGAGIAPAHDDRLKSSYAAAGVNVSFPVFNGHLFSARQREAGYRLEAADQRIKDLENVVAREVTVAALAANTAYRRLDLSAQLLKQADLALDLALERYKLGLSSIVELSQAQLNKTGAEISNASARYEVLNQLAILRYQTGELR
jgi:outer membrane protein